MNWDERENGDHASNAPEASAALYPDDRGTLPFETRRVLVQLLSGPSIDGRRHSKLWPILVRDEELLRSRLSDLFLDLIIDYDQQVAFTRQAQANDLEAPVLLRRLPLTFIDSALLLYLRSLLTTADARGERATVDEEDILEHLLVYEPTANTDHAGFNKRVQASIKKMKDNNMLQKLRGSEQRYEVAPTLKLLFSAEEIQALTRQYVAMMAGNAVAADPEEGEEEDDDS